MPAKHSTLLRQRLAVLSLALLCLSLLIIVAPANLQAAPTQQGIVQILQNTARVRYRSGVEFVIQAKSNTGGEVNQAQLKIRYGTRGREETYDVRMNGGMGSYTLYDNDQTQTLATGMTLLYSWTLSDTKVRLETGQQKVVYEDTSRSWREREGSQVTVRWYAGDDSYGTLMAQLAADTLATYKRRFNIEPTDQIYITIYGSNGAYQTTFPEVPSWSGGFSRYGGIEIVVIAPQDHNASIFIGEGIPHELSHAALYQFLRGPAPRWLDEGFAVYNQNVISIAQYDSLLQTAYQSDSLIPLSKISGSNTWPQEATSAKLAYAESRSMVTFLINSYGNEVWSNLLDQLRRRDLDEAMQAVIGLNLAQAEELWKSKVLGGAKIDLPKALKTGPVTSQPSENDLKARLDNAQAKRAASLPRKVEEGPNWLLLGLGLALVVVLAVLLLWVIGSWRRQRGLATWNWIPGGQGLYVEENDLYVQRYASAGSPFASQSSFISPAPGGPARFPLTPPAPYFDPPAGLDFPPPPPPLTRSGQVQRGQDDPFDLIMTNFKPASPPLSPRPGSPVGADFDPYGLGLDWDQEKQG